MNGPVRRLIVTADDFGAAREVNAAVEIAHRRGVLTAASLMVTAPAAADAVACARRNPALAVGLHLVLVEGRPALPASKVPDLVDGAGRFRSDMARAGATMAFNPAARAQLEAEIEAQFDAFAATALALDHVNAHKHFHLHPTIAGLILKIGARHGLRAARVPVEPRRSLALAEPEGTYSPNPVIDLWAALARRRFRGAGLRVPDQVFGLAWSGAMTARRLRALIDNLPPGLSEIYLHPATGGDFEGAAAGYRYGEELAALIAPEVIEAARASGARRGGFLDFL
ncbi:MAG: hopanoid biosynthesis-associated protein HpnK, partial [Pseudomonadota bacterium]|nr:hopanoid biosynthesis-associated protein HpnK [Pseudomonadota bacterium]